jgi:Ca2+:H+ antiporter
MRCWRSTPFRPSTGSTYGTTNPIESTFATVRHRTIRSKDCLSNKTASAVASIGLSVPAVALVSLWIKQPLELGISAGAGVLMALGFVVAIITYGTGRTNLLAGIVHLVLLATYVFTAFAP